MSRPYGLSAHMLPRHPQMREDELLSSWLVRLAWANRMKVHSLCLLMAGNQATVWNRDIDRLVPNWLLYQIERLAGMSATKIRGASLDQMARLLSGHEPNTLGNEAWILPLGIWHRKRRRFGVQYCPICLHTPRGQYIRRAWRLAFYTECEQHHVLMEDRCRACAAPVTYFRGELGRRALVVGDGMSLCTQCGEPLYGGPVHRFEWPDVELARAIRTLVFMRDFGWLTIQNRVFDSASGVFRVLRHLVATMSSNKVHGELYDAVADQIWPEGYRVLGSRGLAYELRNIEERHRLFGMALWLLLDWPHRFRATFLAAQVGRYAMVQGMQRPLPNWYADEYEQMLGRQASQRPGKAA